MVQVEVSEGRLEGEEVQNEYGGTYYSFRGVPYARPPLGDLRFKPPQKVQPWQGTRDATKLGPKCFQHDRYHWNPFQEDDKNHIGMSEDCLYLNVYTPDPKKLLPVMVYIHGGGYMSESGNDDYYGPQFLIRHGVVIVTLNYRLEALGFLCLHSPDIPGNAGMKDQVAALRWVKKNIGNFGGDTDNITIFGNSAGGSSVAYHLISPMTKGLFRRAIIQSGAAANWWAQDYGSRDKVFLLAKQLGCFSEDESTVYKFLKEQPVESLVNLNLQIWKAQKLYDIHFRVVAEKDFGQERFFYGDVADAIRKGIHEGVEILTGYVRDEGITTLGFGFTLKEFIHEATHFNEFLVPGWIKTDCVLSDQLEVGRKMREFYFKGGEVTKEALFKFLSTDLFTYGIKFSTDFYSLKNKVYFYKFTCITERNIYRDMGLSEPIDDETSVCHADDLPYLFPYKVLEKTEILKKPDKESETFKIITRITTLWTNFAKYGNPTPDDSLGVQWKPYDVQNQEYLDLGNTLKMCAEPDKEEFEFWNSVFIEYLPKYSFEQNHVE